MNIGNKKIYLANYFWKIKSWYKIYLITNNEEIYKLILKFDITKLVFLEYFDK